MEKREFEGPETVDGQSSSNDEENKNPEVRSRPSIYEGIGLPGEDDPADVDDEKVIHGDGNIDSDMTDVITPETKNKGMAGGILRSIFDLVETFAAVTISIILCFAFIFRLNIVDGPSMEDTLHTGEYLIVSDLLYKPTRGDIVVVHDMTAGRYTNPLVKRIIAVGGDVVDIDFDTWTLTVNGEPVDESGYRTLKGVQPPNYGSFPLTVEEGNVFVMGDNRNNSADSRTSEIGQIDERCVVGKVYARVFPFSKLTFFSNPYNSNSEGK